MLHKHGLEAVSATRVTFGVTVGIESRAQSPTIGQGSNGTCNEATSTCGNPGYASSTTTPSSTTTTTTTATTLVVMW
jgi:hypothetical protein